MVSSLGFGRCCADIGVSELATVVAAAAAFDLADDENGAGGGGGGPTAAADANVDAADVDAIDCV